MEFEITKDTIIMDLLNYDPDIASFFLDIGMHCIGCEASSGETIEEACVVHGIEPTLLVTVLKEYLAHKGDNDKK